MALLRITSSLIFIAAASLPAADPPGAAIDPAEAITFPAHPAIINVRAAPYLAAGDGIADDTAAIAAAMRNGTGQSKIVYLPPGTYLVSASIALTKTGPNGENWGRTTLQGHSQAGTTLRLKDNVATNPAQPFPIIRWGGFGSADWFHCRLANLTVSVGRGNPGAVGMQFYSNNTGVVRDVTFRSEDGQGLVGLDLAHDNMNGPLLVQNVTVDGFDTGIRSGFTVNSQTFEGITLRNQRVVGLRNNGQSVSVRRLHSTNAVTAVRNDGLMVVLEAALIGTGAASTLPAMWQGNGEFMARDVAASGYQRVLRDDGPRGGMAGPVIGEYHSIAPNMPFASATRSLRLPIRETPRVPHDPPAQWAIPVLNADPNGDSAPAVQAAIDSGATTVFLGGPFSLRSSLILRGNVRRLMGVGHWVDYNSHVYPTITIADGTQPTVWITDINGFSSGVRVQTDRRVVFQDLTAESLTYGGTGELFFENVSLANYPVTPPDPNLPMDQRFRNRDVWARQLNIENEGPHLANDGGRLWVLGYKTERGGCLLETTNGGRSEVFGNFSYTTTAGTLAPMFITRDASVFAFFGEVCYTGDPYRTLVRETRGAQTREILNTQAEAGLYIANTPAAFPPAADATGDGAVTAADVDLVAAAYGSTVVDPVYRVPADLNRDGRVDLIDLGLVTGAVQAGP